jgi:parallel beta-helix repeat protein
MRKLAIPAFLALLIFACSSDKPTNNNNQGITITIAPARALVDLGTTVHFYCTIDGTDNHSVVWSVDGGATNGTIDTTGRYTAPSELPVNIDSVMITASARADLAKYATAWAILVDPDKIHVLTTGSDTTGLGTRWLPYRTISKALSRAHSGQFVVVGSGEFNVAAGEHFPLRVPAGVSVQGSNRDSTFVIGPGGIDPTLDAIFEINGDAITITNLCISSSNSMGVGVWLRPGFFTTISGNKINDNYIGIYVSGGPNPRPLISNNGFIGDSIGIVTADSSAPLIRNNIITDCPKYGIEIRGLGRPDLGRDSTDNAGNNTIRDCGDAFYHWLVYNGSPNSIFAIGNTWQDQSNPDNNDIYIYDNEESGGTSGEVILVQP